MYLLIKENHYIPDREDTFRFQSDAPLTKSFNISHTYLHLSYPSGQGGLEVRRDGTRPTVSVDLHDSGRVRYGRYHTAGANAVRHTRPDRHQNVGDCDHDGEALHRQTDTIMCVSLRPTSEFTGSPPSGGKWVKMEIPAPINHT